MKEKASAFPRLRSEAAERRFWERHEHAVRGLVEGRARYIPQPEADDPHISLRLPVRMLERIKAEANARDVPYQSLIKIWPEEKLSA